MYDRKTNSYWSQIDGLAIVGELAGTKLTPVSVDTVVWREWKKEHPDSEVLSQDTGFSRPYGRDPYGSYYEDSFLFFQVENRDDRIHPKTVVFLTADAFGVLPPISRLTPEQAMYHFLSGYTAKVAGTERGVTEPVATFSACFGAPFLPRSPVVYANMLGDMLRTHGADVWLVNTGWTGGPYGIK